MVDVAATAALRGAPLAPVLCTDALDFAPDLLAIQERPPARLPRALILTVGLLVALLLAWAAYAQLDIIATAEGRLVPLTFTKVVQPAEGGVVTEILVKDGDLVKENQVLLRLDSRLSKADTVALGNDVALRKMTVRRIEAELADRPFLPGKDDSMQFYEQVFAQFNARRLAYLDAVAQERETLNRARAELIASEQVMAKLTQTLPSYRQSAEAYRNLVTSGFIGEVAAAEKTREFVEKEHDLKTQAANVRGLSAAIAQSERKILSIRSHYRSQLENERLDTVTQLNKSGQELAKSTVKAGQLEIRAPTDGVVKDLATTTRGAVVAAGTLLMNIVPGDEPLQAEVLLKNEDMGFVAVGQKVKVKVAAYQFQKYGLLDGRVAFISADSADPKQQQQQGQTLSLTYRAIVRLEERALKSVPTGEMLGLSPGMLITAEIHQGRRTVLEYLLSPVRKVGLEAARER